MPRRLDAGAMHAAAQRLIGKHDFSTFRDSECQATSPVKTLDGPDVERDGNEVNVTASARSFLHSQVRSMVGSLVMAGIGVSADEWRADDRACGQVAPPTGAPDAGGLLILRPVERPAPGPTRS